MSFLAEGHKPLVIYYLCRPLLFEYQAFSILPNFTMSTDKLQVMCGYTAEGPTIELLELYVTSIYGVGDSMLRCMDKAVKWHRDILRDDRQAPSFARVVEDVGQYYQGVNTRAGQFPTLSKLNIELTRLFGLTFKQALSADWLQFIEGRERNRHSGFFLMELLNKPLPRPLGLVQEQVYEIVKPPKEQPKQEKTQTFLKPLIEAPSRPTLQVDVPWGKR
jgi:hypothetical protein